MRIVALSDLHGHLPEVQPCDLLIVAGDVCPDRVGEALAEHDPTAQKVWFDESVRPWLAASPAAHRILTWGNHDWCGQACNFQGDSPNVASSTALQILVDGGTSVPGNGAAGRAISVWATPWSRRFMHWAFMKSREELAEIYAAIPEGIDVLVSHAPPYGYGDRSIDGQTGEVEHLGSRELLAAIARVKPRLVICGHIHGGHGYFEYNATAIYNVSVLSEQYLPVRSPTVIDIAGW
jgi:Icc-related predicted phosphoesterase